ncbi:LysR family transcriptional regulator substrate-binding protein [Lactobacillus delbrueckii]|uniref:LysR family transcriptional regulator substrate-binding protein n=1 Tax=Lactobacillus delbrueckii TaxID=1584 RepID=UPI002DDCD68A|nr:LysR family transcriptional regulator substrate-binding protein [Lactobacillus delbrueckii]
MNRDKVPFTLTESGQIYYQYLENISAQRHQLANALERFSNQQEEVIRIAILESLGTFLLPKILPAFLTKHPQVKIQIAEGFPHTSEDQLLGGEVDCYMGQTPETVAQGIDTYINGGEVYYIVIPENSKFYLKDHFILDPADYDPKELLQQPFVLSNGESAIRHQVNGLFHYFRVQPNIRMTSNSVITATNLAVNGVGFTISSASILKRLKHLPINLYPLDPRQIKLTYFIGVRRGADLSPALKDLVEAFQAAELQEKIR